MDSTADDTHDLLIAGLLLQLQRLIVQRLQKFLRSLIKEIPQFRSALIRGIRHSLLPHLNPLVRRATIAVHHMALLSNPQQTLGMADKQVAAGMQASIKLVD